MAAAPSARSPFQASKLRFVNVEKEEKMGEYDGALRVVVYNHELSGGFPRWKRLKVALISGLAGFLVGLGIIQSLL